MGALGRSAWGCALILVLHSQPASFPVRGAPANGHWGKTCTSNWRRFNDLLCGLLITLPILFFSVCKWGCQHLDVLSVVLSTFNMFGNPLPGIAVKLLSLRYKISHNAIILSEALNSNPNAHATYVQWVLLWATLSEMGKVLRWLASLSASYFTVALKARISR